MRATTALQGGRRVRPRPAIAQARMHLAVNAVGGTGAWGRRSACEDIADDALHAGPEIHERQPPLEGASVDSLYSRGQERGLV